MKAAGVPEWIALSFKHLESRIVLRRKILEERFISRPPLNLWRNLSPELLELDTDSKTLDYQITNLREYQIMRTHAKEIT